MVKIKPLVEADDFIRRKKEGKSFSEGGLEFFIKVEETEVSRLGVQISSKIANSVTRNRVKRRIKEALSGAQSAKLRFFALSRRLAAQNRAKKDTFVDAGLLNRVNKGPINVFHILARRCFKEVG